VHRYACTFEMSLDTGSRFNLLIPGFLEGLLIGGT